MQCESFHKHVQDWLDGSLDGEVEQAMHSHADSCATCAGLKMDLLNIRRTMGKPPRPELPPSVLVQASKVTSFPKIGTVATSLVLAVFLGWFAKGHLVNAFANVDWVTLRTTGYQNVVIDIDSPGTIHNAGITLILPENVALKSYDQHSLFWATDLAVGNNRSVLPLMGKAGGESELILRIEHENKTRELRVNLRSTGGNFSADHIERSHPTTILT